MASVYSSLRRPRNVALTTRAIDSHPVSPSTTISEFTLRPKTVAMETARMTYGIDRKMSTNRIISVSTMPPKNPATAPNVVPIASEIAVASTPTFSEIRAP